MVAGNELVKGGRVRKMWIVAAHRHHLLLVCHAARRVRNEYRFTAEEKRRDKLPLRRHHLHSPAVAGYLRDRNKVIFLDKIDRLISQIANERGLLAGLDIFLL